MDNRIIGKIFETYEYDQFKILDSNREVRQARKNMLIKSIKNNGYIRNPIVVNEKMEILDGQGRFEACKELGKPIQFTVVKGAGIRECMVLNQYMKNWTLNDFVDSYKNQGNQSYIYFADLLNKYNQGIMVTLSATTDGGSFSKDHNPIKTGTLVISKEDYEKAKKKLDVLIQIDPYIKKINGAGTSVKVAILFALTQKEVDKNRLITAFKKYWANYKPSSTVVGSLDSVSEIYNYHLKRTDQRIYLKEAYDRHKRV